MRRWMLIDFGLPALILILLTLLLVLGLNGEVKGLMAVTIGWIVRSGIARPYRG